MHGYYGHYRRFYDRDAAVTRHYDTIGGGYDELGAQQDLDRNHCTCGINGIKGTCDHCREMTARQRPWSERI